MQGSFSLLKKGIFWNTIKENVWEVKNMIFISHTAADKPIVEPIANRLAAVYGIDQVFYDSWSIQPGDGIIDKMDEGLSKCKFFFFFVSKNSLQSNMVKLEWQNAIIKSTKAQAKIIPVKLDDCMMPSILLQTLYIDVYGKGMENAIRQMIDVINGRNTFVSSAQVYENIRGYVNEISNQKIEIEFRAETYLEPISRYAILIKNTEDDISYKCTSDGMFMNGFNSGIVLNNGISCNAVAITVNRATSPGFPVKVVLESKTELQFLGLMRAENAEKYRVIPCVKNKA